MAEQQTLSDQQLISLLKQGDAGAFTQLFDRYQPLLYVYAVKVIKDRSEALDLIQEVFLYLWDKRQTIEIEGSMLSYLYCAVRYKFYNLLDKKKVRADYVTSLGNFIETGIPLTDHHIREREMLRLIEEQIAALPQKLRYVYELSQKANMTTGQIAQLLNVTEKTVQNQLSLATRQLRMNLEGVQAIGLLIGGEVFLEALKKISNF